MHLKGKDKNRFKVEGWERYSKQIDPESKAKVVMLISSKVNFKQNLVRNDKGHFILIKGIMH
jgi:hypothetical protein